MFDDSSRYCDLKTRKYTASDGRSLVYVTRRLVPPKDVYVVGGAVNVTDSDRIDLVAFRAHGTPAGFWQIADANEAMHPETLTAVPGMRLTIPVPRVGSTKA